MDQLRGMNRGCNGFDSWKIQVDYPLESRNRKWLVTMASVATGSRCLTNGYTISPGDEFLQDELGPSMSYRWYDD